MRLLTTALLVVVSTLACLPSAQAQDAEMRTRFMMMNRHMCPPDNMDEIMDLMRATVAPVLQEMEDAGEIDDWGILTHGWGDEYNFNFFVITESHRAFLDAWDSFVQRNNEADPDWYDNFAPLCTAHKDNMFTLSDFE